MTRRLLIIAVACSALLCLAGGAMWWRSYGQRDRVIYTFRSAEGTWVIQGTFNSRGAPLAVAHAVEAVSISSGDGRIIFSRVGLVIPRDGPPLPAALEPQYAGWTPYTTLKPGAFTFEHPWKDARWVGPGYASGRFGFARADTAWSESWRVPIWLARAREYEAPYWFVVAISAVAPAARVLGTLRRRRLVATGRCPTCGYDMRATPRQCPECGWVSARGGGVRAAR